MEKLILDICCGSRMFWFNKKQENTIYVDNRKENHVLCDDRKLVISPDVIGDFKNVGFTSYGCDFKGISDDTGWLLSFVINKNHLPSWII